MPLPAGVTTATVFKKAPVTFGGGQAKVYMEVTPSVRLVHTATGTPLADFVESIDPLDGDLAQINLPHTDQAGFQDEAGNAFANWHYTARIRFEKDGKVRHMPLQSFQVPTGVTQLDLSTIPAGPAALPTSAPMPNVTSFNGRAGAITLQDADLPARLSETEMSATFAPKPVDSYAVVTFLGNGADNEKLGIHYSSDGITVTAGAANPVHSPLLGVRDPDLYRANGYWYVAYTTNGGADKTLAVARSADLLNWALHATIDVSAVTGIERAWAPQWIEDAGNVYLVFSNYSTTVQMKPWWVKATSADLSAWSAPTALIWDGGANPGGAVIDTEFVRKGAQLFAFFGYGVSLGRAVSTAGVEGVWSLDRAGDWAGGWAEPDRTYEGPSIVTLPDGRFRMYADAFTGAGGAPVNLGYYYAESADLETWTSMSPVILGPGFPPGEQLRHGAFYPVKPGSREHAQVIAATLGGLPALRHAEFYGSGFVQANTDWGGSFTQNDAYSFRSNEFVEPSGAMQLRIKRAGVYSFSLLAQTDAAMGGGYMQIFVDGFAESSYVIPTGTPVQSMPPASNVFIPADKIVKFVFHPNAGVTIQRLIARVTKIQ